MADSVSTILNISTALFREPHLASFLKQKLHEWFALVLYSVVEYGILQILFQCANLA